MSTLRGGKDDDALVLPSDTREASAPQQDTPRQAESEERKLLIRAHLMDLRMT